MKIKFCVAANAVSFFENCHFLSHRPPDFLQGAMHFQNSILNNLNLNFCVPILINNAPLNIRKSANVGQFYPLKRTILYKVAPRKFHILINIAPSLCR